MLRCSVDTAPSRPRNISLRDLLAKIEHVSDGRIRTRLFESGSLFPEAHMSPHIVKLVMASVGA